MEYHLTKKTLQQPGCVLDTAAEQAVDAEFTLPDYCPDVEKILSCTLDPQLYLSNVSGDRLSVEGASRLRVLYLDGEKGCMRSYDYSVPFSQSLPLKESPADCAVYVQAKPEYLNCRALSPRKLSLHGAFSLCVKVMTAAGQEYYDYEEEDDLQTRRDKLAVSALSGLCSECFTVQEDIPVNAKSGVSAVLGYRIGARITELKAMHDKIMLSAELKPELMLQCGADRSATECMSYSIPVSRVIDCKGADENTVIDGDLSVMSGEIRLMDDALDGSAVLSADVKLCFNALCFAEEEISVLSDAFSTGREAQVRTAPFTCRAKTRCLSETDVGKAKVEPDEEIGTIKDVHCEKLTASSSVSDGMMTVQTKLRAGILYENSDGETRYVERDANFVFRREIGEDCMPESLKVSAESLSYRLTDSQGLELRAELCYRMTLCGRVNGAAVTAVSADDDAPEKPADSALILYYADSGDTVWAIAKRYASRPADIIAENELEDDAVEEGMMLLIPTA